MAYKDERKEEIQGIAVRPRFEAKTVLSAGMHQYIMVVLGALPFLSCFCTRMHRLKISR